MRTDAHRWLGCVGFSHRIHGIHRNEWRRRASHGFHRCTQIVRLRRVLWEDSLVGCVGMAGMPYPPNLCTSVQSVGEYLAPVVSVCSVCSVGEYLASETSVGSVASVGRWFGWLRGYGRMPYPPNLCTSAICGRKSCVRKFCGFCGFCGKIIWRLRGYGRMPYPPIVCSVSIVGALLALASGKAERRQLHPWSCTPLKFATRLQNIFPNFVKDYFSLSD